MRRYRRGKGIYSNLYYRVHGALFGATTGPKAVKSLLEKHGHEQVYQIRVCRKPIQSTIERILHIVSFGRLGQVKKELNYDHLMHLYCFIDTSEGTHFSAEKNEIVQIKYNRNPFDDPGAQCVLVPMGTERPTVRSLFENAERSAGQRFWRYDPFNRRGGGNCQDWITTLLKASNLLTPALGRFINQDIESIVKALPPGFSLFARAVTELAARLRLAVAGDGFRKLSGPVPRMPRKHLWIKSAIRHPGIFRALAAKEHGLTPRGTISSSFIRRKIHSRNPTIRRRAVLAHTLSRLPRHHGPRHHRSMLSGMGHRRHRRSVMSHSRHPLTGLGRRRRKHHRGGTVLRAFHKTLPPFYGGRRRRVHHRRHVRGSGFWGDFLNGFKKGFTGVFKAAAPIAGLIPETKGLAPVFSTIGSLGSGRRRHSRMHMGRARIHRLTYLPTSLY